MSFLWVFLLLCKVLNFIFYDILKLFYFSCCAVDLNLTMATLIIYLNWVLIWFDHQIISQMFANKAKGTRILLINVRIMRERCKAYYNSIMKIHSSFENVLENIKIYDDDDDDQTEIFVSVFKMEWRIRG